MSAWNPERWITDKDRHRSRTSHSLDDLHRVVSTLKGFQVNRLLDIGCGHGGLAALVGEFLDADEIHGIDIDDRVEAEAKSKNLEVVITDAGSAPLPYEDAYFDFLMTLGMMDYLVSFDGLIREMNRVVKPGGEVLVTLPNLASWHNRLGLLMGYQPRDIEFSSEILAGVSPGYKGETPAGHIHIPTLGGFTDLMTHHGFETVTVMGGRPRQRSVAAPLFLIDKLLARRPSLARRFYYVGRKVYESPPVPDQKVDLPHQSLL